MLRKIISVFCLSLLGYSSFGQLTAGDIMFIGVNYDGEDGFSIINLVAIPANTTIYMTDNVWDGSDFGTDQNELTWISDGSVTPAGTVITFNETKDAGTITVTSGTVSGVMKLNGTGDMLYVFVGLDASSPDTFITAFSNDVIGGAEVDGTLTGTGLTVGVNATEFTNNDDVFIYSGSTICDDTVAACAAQFSDADNWTSRGGNGDQSSDGGGTDFPSDILDEEDFDGQVLPVELLSFDWSVINGKVELTWETSSEVDNWRFHVEKSLTGDHFYTLANVEGNGTTSLSNSYSCVDEVSIGSAYYRLTQEDFDGQSEVIGIVYVFREKQKSAIVVYPNPTYGKIKLSGEITQYKLFDAAGTPIIANNLTTSVIAEEEISTYLESAKSGMYFLIFDKDQISPCKIVKK